MGIKILLNFKSCFYITIFVCTFFQNSNSQVIQLRQMNVKRDKVTLSGFQSGGGMAQQVQFSHSSLFSGIAVFSGTYYRCGPGNGSLMAFDAVCTKMYNFTANYCNQIYDPNQALLDIHEYSKNGLIDDIQNLQNTKMYVYAGLLSSLFTTDMSLNILKIYEPFLSYPVTSIKTRVQDAELLLPSDSFGATCTEDAESNYFIGNCELSGPLEALQFLLGSHIIRQPTRHDFNDLTLQPLLSFDQSEFYADESLPHYIHPIGFIYIPTKCASSKFGQSSSSQACYLHIYFHGCQTGVDFVGTNHIQHSGFLEIAEVNNIIMLFPQNLRSDEEELEDLGCWDTYGYTGPDFATKEGVQVRIVKKILDRILLGNGDRHQHQHQHEPVTFIEETEDEHPTEIPPKVNDSSIEIQIEEERNAENEQGNFIITVY